MTTAKEILTIVPHNSKDRAFNGHTKDQQQGPLSDEDDMSSATSTGEDALAKKEAEVFGKLFTNQTATAHGSERYTDSMDDSGRIIDDLPETDGPLTPIEDLPDDDLEEVEDDDDRPSFVEDEEGYGTSKRGEDKDADDEGEDEDEDEEDDEGQEADMDLNGMNSIASSLSSIPDEYSLSPSPSPSGHTSDLKRKRNEEDEGLGAHFERDEEGVLIPPNSGRRAQESDFLGTIPPIEDDGEPDPDQEAETEPETEVIKPATKRSRKASMSLKPAARATTEEIDEEDADDDEEQEEEVQEESEEGTGTAEDEDDIEYQKKHKAALEALTSIELEFAKLREKVYEERQKELDQEKRMILDGTHPELNAMMAEIDDKRKNKLKLADAWHRYRAWCCDRQLEGAKYLARRSAMDRRAALRREMMEKLNKCRWDLEEERTKLNDILADFELVPDKAAMQCVRKYWKTEAQDVKSMRDTTGFPLPPNVSGASERDIVEDFEALEYARMMPPPPQAPGNLPLSHWDRLHTEPDNVFIDQGHLWYHDQLFRKGDGIMVVDPNGGRFSAKLLTIGESEIVVQRTDGSKSRIPITAIRDGKYQFAAKA
ncbi:hypothetical protein BZG36_00774 [Bifiguratus adelaidae]|uniref:Sds3-like-domain-containing protein n=1 Tax=Bifiguratus adelaidae TaxID=1938954 RepID=A0A261Y6L2_9FUNG|nr:hypothetical protein BZG36_00774 [Bifiguratus adelaidae]